MKLSTKIAYNTIVQIISKIISTILGLLSIAIITRYLGQNGFGEFTTIITFVSFFAILSDLGLTLVTTQMISRPGADENKIINNIFTLRLVTVLLFLFLAVIMVFFFPYNQIIKVGVLVAAFSFLFTALNQVFVALFQKKLRLDKVSIAEVVSRFILLLLIWLVARNNWGLLGIITATTISGIINFFFHYYFSKKYLKIKLSFDKEIWRETFSLSWPLATTIVLNLIYLKTDILILSLVKTQADVGIYGAAYRVIDVLITIPYMFAGIILPLLTFNWVNKNKEKFYKILSKAIDFMIIFAMPAIMLTQVLADDIMIFIAGEEFAPSGSVLKLLVIASGFIFIGCLFSHAIIALNKQKKIIWAYGFTAFSSLIAYFIFIPKYSYYGAAWVTIYSEAFIALTAIYLVWKYSAFKFQWLILLKTFVASSLMAVALIYWPDFFINANLNLLLKLFFAGFLYLFLLLVFKGISKKDILILLNR